MSIEDIIKKHVRESEERIQTKPKPEKKVRHMDFRTKVKTGIIKKSKHHSHYTKAGVYEIKCLNTGKVYVGQSTDIKKRWKEHKDLLNKAQHHNKRLQADWTLHGKEAFSFSIIQKHKPVPHYCFDGLVSNLIRMEKRYILQNKGRCYNIWLEDKTFISEDGTLFEGSFQK